ncbi:MAG: hypothetical protein PHE17_19465 [Thiothrix sp.]|uniref:hypothetical protein n=1 Tax=Thiothrix sp. TaxID=1032 RepID=UPI0026283036|nr:hypothetical protein [Thiothrix sp.]MDD5395207.1 hypothetical protein [Thiothrix sp.]
MSPEVKAKIAAAMKEMQESDAKRNAKNESMKLHMSPERKAAIARTEQKAIELAKFNAQRHDYTSCDRKLFISKM